MTGVVSFAVELVQKLSTVEMHVLLVQTHFAEPNVLAPGRITDTYGDASIVEFDIQRRLPDHRNDHDVRRRGRRGEQPADVQRATSWCRRDAIRWRRDSLTVNPFDVYLGEEY